MTEIFARVILPLSLHDSYTYRVPEQWRQVIKPGQRVVVQFGQKRLYAAIVVEVTTEKPANIEIKDIQQIIDEEPVVHEINLKLWNWIAAYYCCTLGDVFRAALPTGLKMESKSAVGITGSDYDGILSGSERIILNNLESKNWFLEELQKKLGKDFSFSALKSLLVKNLIFVEEEIDEKIKSKTETILNLHPSINSEEILEEKIKALKRAPKQVALLYHFLHKSGFGENGKTTGISRNELFTGTDFNPSLLNELLKKNVLTGFEKRVLSVDEETSGQVSLNMLNKYQDEALQQIKDAFGKQQVTLIHGITASGKTEVYIHLIDEAIKSGRQALYLVPEIALTTQIVKRLKNVFGNKVGIYHSKMSSRERVEIWEQVLRFGREPGKGYQVILGARSSLFLPFSDLGLIVVDEEHENSYKQYDPAPRYNARDMAVVLASQHDARVLLGSATPSLESYFNAKTGKYALVELTKMHADIEFPEIVTIDVKEARKRKQMRSVLTPVLFNEIEKSLVEKSQVILFQNRRGYSPFVECFSCGHIPKCVNCDVSLVYHKSRNQLVCHYCGYTEKLQTHCPACGSPELKTRGTGTEKVEDELKNLFRGARIARMDTDTTQNKNAFEKIIHNLETGKTDILVGTQMVTKGIDLEHVYTVGILNADNLVNFPDFRAHERAYQLIAQVSGRAGRKNRQGKVFIQTSQPENPLFGFILNRDFASLAAIQLHERKLFRYPPYYRLIKVVVKHKNPDTVDKASVLLAAELRKQNHLNILGPVAPMIGRIQNWYHREIWLKFDRNQNQAQVKELLVRLIGNIRQLPMNSGCSFNIDVDPQ